MGILSPQSKGDVAFQSSRPRDVRPFPRPSPKPSNHSFSIISEFNRRPDHLTAILKHGKGLKGHLGYLYIATIAHGGDHVLIMYHPPPEEKEVQYKLTFDPPTKSVFEVRSRLYAMRREALQVYRVVRVFFSLHASSQVLA